MLGLLSSLIVFMNLIAPVFPLYFLLEKDVPQRCFLEDHPDETILLLKISFLDYADGRFITVNVKPDELESDNTKKFQLDRFGRKVIFEPLTWQVTAPVSTYDFEVTSDGSYLICISAGTQHIASKWRVGLEISKGPDEDSYNDLALRDELDPLQIEFVKLNDRATSILREADYMRTKEVNFHKSSLAMNGTALWWPIVQMLILSTAGFLQVKYLKSFFKKKKLI